MKLISHLVVLVGLLTPAVAFGVTSSDYVPLVGLPLTSGGGEADLQQFLSAAYKFAIGLAAVMAVGRLVFAGAQYMLTDVVPQKTHAKDSIKAILIGLVVVLSAVLMLNTINPQLTELDRLHFEPVKATAGSLTMTETDYEKVVNYCLKSETGCVKEYCRRGCRSSCKEKGGVYRDTSKWFDAHCLRPPEDDGRKKRVGEIKLKNNKGRFNCKLRIGGNNDCSEARANCENISNTRWFYPEHGSFVGICFQKTGKAN